MLDLGSDYDCDYHMNRRDINDVLKEEEEDSERLSDSESERRFRANKKITDGGSGVDVYYGGGTPSVTLGPEFGINEGFDDANDSDLIDSD